MAEPSLDVLPQLTGGFAELLPGEAGHPNLGVGRSPQLNLRHRSPLEPRPSDVPPAGGEPAPPSSSATQISATMIHHWAETSAKTQWARLPCSGAPAAPDLGNAEAGQAAAAGQAPAAAHEVLLDAQRLTEGLVEVEEFSRRVLSACLKGVHVRTAGVPPQPADAEPARPRRLEVADEDGQQEYPSWRCLVEPAPYHVRAMLKDLLGQQSWTVPGRSVTFSYSLNRAVQSVAPASQQRFELLKVRDASRKDMQPSCFGLSLRAFFCDHALKLTMVISSPLGFTQAFQGAALLFALDLPEAEALGMTSCQEVGVCGASEKPLVGRALIAELVLGECCTARCSLEQVLYEADEASSPWGSRSGSALPFVPSLQAEYCGGADSVYFSQCGVIALLSPERAQPLYLTDYSRRRSG